MSLYRVADLARELGETVPTLHWWQSQMHPYIRVPRTKGRERWYGPEHVAQFREVQRLIRVELYTIAGAKRQLRLAAERAKECG